MVRWWWFHIVKNVYVQDHAFPSQTHTYWHSQVHQIAGSLLFPVADKFSVYHRSSKSDNCYQSLNVEAVLHSLGLFVEKQSFSQTHCARYFKRSLNKVKVLWGEAAELVFASCLLDCSPSSSVVKFGTLIIISFSFSSCKSFETYLCGLPA